MFATIHPNIFRMTDNIAQELRLFRKRLRYTQQELASRIGASRGQYANWETGAARPPMEFVQALQRMGFQSVTGVAETRAAYSEPDKNRVSLLIDIVFDTSIDTAIRSRAKGELETMFGIDSQKN